MGSSFAVLARTSLGLQSLPLFLRGWLVTAGYREGIAVYVVSRSSRPRDMCTVLSVLTWY